MTETDCEIKRRYFPCWRCEKKVEVYTRNPILRIFCEDCKNQHEEEKKKTLQEYIILKVKVMHERALRFLEKQEIGLHRYKEAAAAVLEFALEDTERFASSHEMIAAMELIRNRIRIKVQQKILGHRVDFVLPDFKIVLEIDGYMHDYTELKDSKRDLVVRKELGDEWEIVRIPTKYIEKNTTLLVDAIEEVRKLKRDIRSKNNGIIPEWYSKREKTLYKKVIDEGMM